MESVVLESPTLRRELGRQLEGRTEALDKVKALTLLPDGLHVTVRMAADYFEVGEEVIRQLLVRHRKELAASGARVLRGADLETFKSDTMSLFSGSYPQARSGLTVLPRRAVLNVAMLLRDSEVARAVRQELLDAAEGHWRAGETGPWVRAFRARPRPWSGLRWDEYERTVADPAAREWQRRIDGEHPFDPVELRLLSIERRLDAGDRVIAAIGQRLCRHGDDLRAVREDLRVLRLDVTVQRGRRRR
ncbi:hypothetical protein AB0D08_18600 [Kitasatospora sp. NPDC048540]|uniref:hypothetical protein n=1 Tax=unclassified Kitasatospora TaxID=2633591 RepID=UPI000539DFB1|nr:hypothetical protein [Kitasatospora sp. MBT63]